MSDGLRRIARTVRTRLHPAGSTTGVANRAAQLVDAGLVDVAWYLAQDRSTAPDPVAVATDYVRHGWRQGLTPNPLFLPAWADKGSEQGHLNVTRLLRRLSSGRLPAHPLFDHERYLAEHPEAASHPAGALGSFLTTSSPSDLLPAAEGVAVTWGRARELLLDSARQRQSSTEHRDRDAADRATQAAPDRVRDRLSVLLTATGEDWSTVVRAVDGVIAATQGCDLEVVVQHSAGSQVASGMLSVLLATRPGVRASYSARVLSTAAARNDAVALCTGEYVALLALSVRPAPGWSGPLVAELAATDAAAVGPVLVGADGTVWSAGIVFSGDVPMRLLAGHPREDATRLGTFPVAAHTADCLVLRAQDIARHNGFDTRLDDGWDDVDLCLRITAGSAAEVRTVSSSCVVQLGAPSAGRADMPGPALVERLASSVRPTAERAWAHAGFELAGTTLRVRRSPLPADRLRWAIKVAAPAGSAGDRWGDVYYAASLATALERLGHAVSIDRREAHDRRSGEYDDVTLVLRGLEQYEPRPGPVNLLWVISHPDLVTQDELRAFDHVFAASARWASTVTAETGVPVDPLLQATDPALFNPERADPDSGHPVVFVGSSRHVRRRIVQDAVDIGLDLAVFGPNWSSFYPDAPFLHDPVPNAEVGRIYRSAGVVLNDHWDDMAAHGFVSNRLFDAVASGARVISDPVEGIAELFGGAVRTYSGAAALRELTSGDLAARFPDDAERVRIARQVAREHSFDARAAVLHRTVCRLRRAR